MRSAASIAFLVAMLAIHSGCAPELYPFLDPAVESGEEAKPGVDPTGTEPGTVPQASPSQAQTMRINGVLDGPGDYRLFPLGGMASGELLTIRRNAIGSGRFLVVIFDEDYCMLRRGVLSVGGSVSHVLRADVPELHIGIAPSSTSSGGSFDLTVSHQPSTAIPGPAPQLVYLDYRGATNLRVNSRTGLTFGDFDAAQLGARYAGETAEVKAIILREMERDYAAYDVQFVTSDQGPPPAGVHSVVHFGGLDNALLGLADNVDQWNEDPAQHAIVFVETFRLYESMNLTTEQIAQMVANTASHELGHLLGLYHTAKPDDLMDTTGSVWDLVADQDFRDAAPLEASVFPFGYESNQQLLTWIVGLRPGGPLPVAKETTAKALSRQAVEGLMETELPTRCGNCLHPDD